MSRMYIHLCAQYLDSNFIGLCSQKVTNGNMQVLLQGFGAEQDE